MSKTLNIPVSEPEIVEWAMNLMKLGQKRGIRVYNISVYSHMVGHGVVVTNPSVYEDYFDLEEYLKDFCEQSVLTYKIIQKWWNEGEAEAYFDKLSEWIKKTIQSEACA